MVKKGKNIENILLVVLFALLFNPVGFSLI